jgi:hypothetical protein
VTDSAITGHDGVVPHAEPRWLVDDVPGGLQATQRLLAPGRGADTDHDAAGVVVLDDPDRSVVDLQVTTQPDRTGCDVYWFRRCMGCDGTW